MKLRALLAIGLVVAAALWLLLETRATRAGGHHASTQEPRASPDSIRTPRLAAVQIPGPATDEPEAVESPRTPLAPSPSPASQASAARAASPSRGRLVDERTRDLLARVRRALETWAARVAIRS